MKFLLLRRLSQITIFALFIIGNFTTYKILQGDLSSSKLLKFIPLSDPFATLQLFLSGFSLASDVILGAILITIFYALIAPRVFCAWVCPVNIITDFASFVRKVAGYNSNIINISRQSRYYILATSLILSFILEFPIFESISFIGIVQRGIIFLSTSAISVAVIIFAIDCFLGSKIVCSKICPLGAFWATLSKKAFFKITHIANNCTKCMKCKSVCPEVHVLSMVGKFDAQVGSECISCGRCIDMCNDNALKFDIKKGKL